MAEEGSEWWPEKTVVEKDRRKNLEGGEKFECEALGKLRREEDSEEKRRIQGAPTHTREVGFDEKQSSKILINLSNKNTLNFFISNKSIRQHSPTPLFIITC